MADKAPPKRRLTKIDVDEISIVDSPAIGENFVRILKSMNKGGEVMSIAAMVKAAREKAGVAIEKVAELSGLDLEKLNKFEGGDETSLSEDDLAKVAMALGLDKFEPDEEEKKKEQAAEGEPPPAEEKKEEEPPAAEGEGGKVSLHRELLSERLGAIRSLLDEIDGEVTSGGSDVEKISKTLNTLSNAIWSIHPVAEIAMLTKSVDVSLTKADVGNEDIQKAFDTLIKALEIAKVAAVKDSEVKKAAPKAASDDLTKALTKKIESLEGKIEGLLKSGLSKSGGEDDLKKKAESEKAPTWDCLNGIV